MHWLNTGLARNFRGEGCSLGEKEHEGGREKRRFGVESGLGFSVLNHSALLIPEKNFHQCSAA